MIPSQLGLPRGLKGKEFTCQCRRCRRHGFNPWIRKIPWRRKWQPTPVLLPGKFHGQQKPTLQSMGLQRVRYDWVSDHTHIYWGKEEKVLKESNYILIVALTLKCCSALCWKGYFTTTYTVAAAAVKSLQSCLTLWDPIDGSPSCKFPILQLFELWTFKDANTYSIHVSVCLISRVQLFVTSWTVTCQALLSKHSPGKNIGEGCHFLLRGSSQPRYQTHISCIARQILYHWATWEAQCQAWEKSQLALHFVLLTILQLYHLPPPSPSPSQ